MTESRKAFEAYFAESRRSRGAGKRPTFEQLEDGTYKDNHTQRHWWTWQKAQAAMKDIHRAARESRIAAAFAAEGYERTPNA